MNDTLKIVNFIKKVYFLPLPETVVVLVDPSTEEPYSSNHFFNDAPGYKLDIFSSLTLGIKVYVGRFHTAYPPTMGY